MELTTMTIRIVLVDDHPIVREGLAAVLSTQPDFDIVGQANDGAEAIDLVSALRPDIVVLDLVMPNMDGVQALRAMRAEHHDLKAWSLQPPKPTTGSSAQSRQALRAIC